MNDTELKMLWQETNNELAKSFAISKKQTEEITKLKVDSLLSSIKPVKIFALIIGIIWVLGISGLIIYLTINHYESISKYFLISAIVQVVLSAIAIVYYILQLNLLNKIDYAEPIFEIQSKLLKFKTSSLNVVRISCLQLPVWTTFYLSETLLKNSSILILVVQALITATFAYLGIWLFRNINFKNKDKKWFTFLFRGKEWKPILKAIEMLNEIENCKSIN